MTKPLPGSNVTQMRLTQRVAQARIRAISLDSGLVTLTHHALERMSQRGFTSRDVYRILQTGFVDDAPVEVGKNDWKCKVVQKVGSRHAGVVTIIVRDEELVVKTVEWEDSR